MEKVEVTSNINASPQRVFDYITNPANIPIILPGLVENSNVPELPLKDGSVFNYKYQMYGMVFDGTWTVLDIKSPNIYKAHTTGGIESDWLIEINESNGGSEVKLTVSYEIPGMLFKKITGAILKKINEKEGELMIHNLKTLLESED